MQLSSKMEVSLWLRELVKQALTWINSIYIGCMLRLDFSCNLFFYVWLCILCVYDISLLFLDVVCSQTSFL